MTHSLINHAIEMRDRLIERAPAVEAQRHADQSTVDELARHGLYRMLVPRDYGGEEVAPLVFARALEEIARADAATAWCVMTGATTGMLSAYMSPEGASELWGQKPDMVMAGIFAPMGKAVRTGDSYRVSGRWPFASGCQVASWHSGGALVFEDGKPVMDEDGTPTMVTVFFPASESRIHDTWDTAGMRGTGSHDIEVQDLEIPLRHTATIVGKRPNVDGPLYAFPAFGLLAHGVAACATGLALSALDAFRELMLKKKKPGQKKPMAGRELVQVSMAHADAELAAGRALVRQTLEEVWDTAQSTGAISLADRARVRAAASQAVKASTRAVDRVYTLAGGTSLYERSPLARHMRDIHTVTQHIMVSPATDQLIGRVLLDQESDFRQL